MKSVAVSQRIDWIESRSEHRDSLDQKLSDLLVEVGFLSFPVPNGMKLSKTRHINSWLEKLSPDAVVLSGGNDIAEFDSVILMTKFYPWIVRYAQGKGLDPDKPRYLTKITKTY